MEEVTFAPANLQNRSKCVSAFVSMLPNDPRFTVPMPMLPIEIWRSQPFPAQLELCHISFKEEALPRYVESADAKN